jgi:hypothetical protein
MKGAFGLRFGLLLSALNIVLEDPDPGPDGAEATGKGFADLLAGLDCMPPVTTTDWPDLKKKLFTRASDDAAEAIRIYVCGITILTLHPGALLQWLKIAPPSSFPPVERALLLLQLSRTEVGKEEANWVAKDLIRAKKNWLVEQPTDHSPAQSIPKPRKPELILTRSQAAVMAKLEAMAGAYFSGVGHELSLTPRYNALLIAATGSGKTKMVGALAEKIGAKLHTVSIGEWIVLGARHQPATVTSLLRVLEKSKKTVLLLDEVDKFGAFDSTWSKYCAAEIWALLDRRLPLEEYASNTHEGAEPLEELRDRIQHGLYIVGAGTFQSIWEKVERRDCGFHHAFSDGAIDFETEILKGIRKQNLVSPELLSRFSPKPLLLRYPSVAETSDLLERFGLNKLARSIGVTIDPASVEWHGVGLRALEQLSAELLLIREQREADQHVSLECP